jgi:hypothetical protein
MHGEVFKFTTIFTPLPPPLASQICYFLKYFYDAGGPEKKLGDGGGTEKCSALDEFTACTEKKKYEVGGGQKIYYCT